MVIIAESGSTKTNWLTEKNELFETIGFNPLFFTSEEIYNEMLKNAALLKLSGDITQVYFYGASCSSPERNKIVRDGLQQYFTNAVIEVHHDMEAAAFATYNGRKGIACILGTGSNSCIYDGKDLSGDVPALGYALGDEGSGAYFGKKLVALYLYHRLPSATDKLLREKYKLEKEDAFDRVYKQPRPNVYLARFAMALSESPDKEFMEELVEEGFTEFFEYHIACYEGYRNMPVHFVGSIAFHFKHVLQKVADKFGCEIGNVNRSPVYSLLEWHLKTKQGL